MPAQCRKLLDKVGALLRRKPDPCPKSSVRSADPDEAVFDLGESLVYLEERKRAHPCLGYTLIDGTRLLGVDSNH